MDKLKQSGFKDIEKADGTLKRKNIHTISNRNRERIRDFFTRLGHLIYNDPHISESDLQILSLYCEGVYIKVIAETMKRTPRTIYSVIKRYQVRVL